MMTNEYLTAEQIVNQAEQEAETDSNEAIRSLIDKKFKAQDDSSKWPINGAFNVTEKAIKETCKLESQTGEMEPFVYALSLELKITEIVNQEY